LEFIPTKWRAVLIVLACVAMSMCSGCCSAPNKADPFEKVNRFFYGFNDLADRVALKPASDLYVKVIPPAMRADLSHGFDNLGYFNVIFNDLLQGKGSQGLGDFARMAANSTIGIGGIADVATNWGLPSHDNDFGLTLAKWGMKQQAYLVIPLYGPSTLREATNFASEEATDPLTWLYLPSQVTIPMDVTQVLDLRSRSDIVVKFRNAAALDPYVFTREAYLQFRQSKVDEGKPAVQQNLYDEDLDTGPATTQPTTKTGE
jgi:phospholipid-binding lipoprotein MlaA